MDELDFGLGDFDANIIPFGSPLPNFDSQFDPLPSDQLSVETLSPAIHEQVSPQLTSLLVV